MRERKEGLMGTERENDKEIKIKETNEGAIMERKRRRRGNKKMFEKKAESMGKEREDDEVIKNEGKEGRHDGDGKIMAYQS